MSLVTASIRIAAAPADVWKMVMDPSCLGEWVTIHRKLVHADDGPPRVGYTMDQQIHMRGVSLEVHWTLVDCRPGRARRVGGTWPGALARTQRVRPHRRGWRNPL